MKGAEKIIEALTQLMEGYCDLQDSIERDYGSAGTEEGEESSELSTEVDAALVTEIRSALETVMEDEDYSAEEIAAVISVLTDSLEEIDPDVFENDSSESKEKDEDEEDEEEDEDEEDEDLDEDFDEDDDDDE